MFIKDGSGKPVSPMHDIPMLASDGIYNMVVEVPRWTNAKIEIDLKSALNPLKQDVKKGKLRLTTLTQNNFEYLCSALDM